MIAKGLVLSHPFPQLRVKQQELGGTGGNRFSRGTMRLLVLVALVVGALSDGGAATANAPDSSESELLASKLSNSEASLAVASREIEQLTSKLSNSEAALAVASGEIEQLASKLAQSESHLEHTVEEMASSAAEVQSLKVLLQERTDEFQVKMSDATKASSQAHDEATSALKSELSAALARADAHEIALVEARSPKELAHVAALAAELAERKAMEAWAASCAAAAPVVAHFRAEGFRLGREGMRLGQQTQVEAQAKLALVSPWCREVLIPTSAKVYREDIAPRVISAWEATLSAGADALLALNAAAASAKSGAVDVYAKHIEPLVETHVAPPYKTNVKPFVDEHVVPLYLVHAKPHLEATGKAASSLLTDAKVAVYLKAPSLLKAMAEEHWPTLEAALTKGLEKFWEAAAVSRVALLAARQAAVDQLELVTGSGGSADRLVDWTAVALLIWAFLSVLPWLLRCLLRLVSAAFYGAIALIFLPLRIVLMPLTFLRKGRNKKGATRKRH